MNILLQTLACLLLGYLLGSLSPSFLAGKLRGYDVRESGSGNAGASNTVILAGRFAGLIVALLDILKATCAWWLCAALFPGLRLSGILGGVGAILGHMFPLWLRFHGGKGLACLGGVILAYDWRTLLLMLAVAIAIGVVTKETELALTLTKLSAPPKLVVTDSQVFGKVAQIVPKDVPLTSFSILFSRYKGYLTGAVRGVKALDSLRDGDIVLISEGCTHHRQCGDIGTEKLPKLIRKHCGKNVQFEFTSGTGFPDDLSRYAVVVHCGGCMLTEREMHYRAKCADDQNIPFTNYGIAIAHMTGILQRSIEPLGLQE